MKRSGITAHHLPYKYHEPSKQCRLVNPILHKPPLQLQDARFVLVRILTVLHIYGLNYALLPIEPISGHDQMRDRFTSSVWIFRKDSCTASGQEQKFFLTDQQWVKALEVAGLSVVSLKKLGALSTLLLCRFTNNAEKKPIFLDVDDSFTFVPKLQTALASNDRAPIWLCSFTSSPTGIVGMTNCLRREIGGEKIRCLFARPENKGKVMEQFKALRKLDLVMNVFEDGKFGSYR